MPESEDAQRSIRDHIPLGRFGTASEIGEAAAFLSSPLAGYITGNTLMVDGGMNLMGSGLMSKSLAAAAGQ